MSKTKLKETSKRFLRLLKLSIVSFIIMGILIGYYGAPLINSVIGVFWFIFAVTAGLVVMSANSKDSLGPDFENPSVSCEKRTEERRIGRSIRRQKVSESA